MQDTQIDAELTVTIDAGSVEYSLDEAAMPIDDLIELLEQAKEEGATHVVGTSGNYRGAQWVRFREYYGWASDE